MRQKKQALINRLKLFDLSNYEHSTQ